MPLVAVNDRRPKRDSTHRLIEQRREAFTARHGTPVGPDHVWLAQRHHELDALDAILDRRAHETTGAVRGAGADANGRRLLPLTPVATDGAHHTTLTRQQPDGETR